MKMFDVVSAVIDGRHTDLQERFHINEEYLDILREYCDIIDVMISNHDGSEITADILEENNNISITVELSDFTYETKFKPRSYLDLMERAVSMKFTNRGSERLGVEFVFPSVWEAK